MRTQGKKGQLELEQDNAVAHIKLIQGKSAMTVYRGLNTSLDLLNPSGLFVLTAALRLCGPDNLYSFH